MKRVEKETGVLKWRKEGGGSLRFGGRIIKPNEVFEARAEEIPNNFKDCIVCLSSKGEIFEIEEAVEEIIPVQYSLQKNEEKKSPTGAYLWDIVDEKGKVINETPMTKKEAEETIKVL
ncbi:MAG: hypothetical protein KKC20_24655 [Proteobacteria bacterium]|nr:hypothetical protein [Pseudomonadota bacterium]